MIHLISDFKIREPYFVVVVTKYDILPFLISNFCYIQLLIFGHFWTFSFMLVKRYHLNIFSGIILILLWDQWSVTAAESLAESVSQLQGYKSMSLSQVLWQQTRPQSHAQAQGPGPSARPAQAKVDTGGNSGVTSKWFESNALAWYCKIHSLWS